MHLCTEFIEHVYRTEAFFLMPGLAKRGEGSILPVNCALRWGVTIYAYMYIEYRQDEMRRDELR